MSGDSTQTDTRLDDSIVKSLESSIPLKAKELLDYLRTKRTITLHNVKFDTQKEQVKAYTRNYTNHSEIWLTTDHEYTLDSFVHEIGQVNLAVLGYKLAAPKRTNDVRHAQLLNMLIVFINNAFIGTVAEQKLENYGIDRSFYKTRAKQNFDAFLNNKIPSPDSPEHRLIAEAHNKSMLCYMYVANRLLLGKEFEYLDSLWEQKIRLSAVKNEIRTVYLEAAKKEITPERFVYLQRFFAKTLGLGNIFA